MKMISPAGPLSHKNLGANVPFYLISTHKMTHPIKCYLNGNIVSGYDGLLQGRKPLLINLLSNHHLGSYINEVHSESLRNKGEGSGCSQVALNHLNGEVQKGRNMKASNNNPNIHSDL